MRKPKVRRPKIALDVFWGDEPELTKSSTRIDYIRAYNWYNANCDNNDAKEYVLSYLKGQKVAKSIIRKISDLHPNSFRSIGWNCRILDQGGVLPPGEAEAIQTRIDALVEAAPTNSPEPTAPEVPTISIQQRVHDKAGSYIAELEEELDKFYLDNSHAFDASDWFSRNQVKPKSAKIISEYYSPLYSEVMDAQSGKLTEGYKRWKKSGLKKYAEFVRVIVAAASGASVMQRTTRKPRKKKVKPAAVLVAKMQYKAKDEHLNITSIPSTEIIGAQQAWVFNTRYRKLSVFNAMDDAGLSVRGTTIIGYDPKTSITKMVRKPEKVLPEVLKGGKVALRKVMDTIKCKSREAKGRLNSDVLLLRASK